MQQIEEIIIGDVVAHTNYGALIKLWITTKCPKCKQKYFDELYAFDKYNKKVYDIWRRKTIGGES